MNQKLIVALGTVTISVGAAVSTYGHDKDHPHVDHAPAGHERLVVAQTSAQSSQLVTLVADHLEYTPGAASDKVIYNINGVAMRVFQIPPTARG